MVSKVKSMGIFGMQSFMVEVETDVSGAKYRFDIVGLPDTAVSESRERVQAAIKNSGYAFPFTHITVNLAPADVRKEGSLYDLPILISLLAAGRQIPVPEPDSAFIGELSLAGEVRAVDGVLPMVIEARGAGMRRVFVPAANAAEAAIVEGVDVYPVDNVKALVGFLKGEPDYVIEKALPVPPGENDPVETLLDMADVKGQGAVKRALEVAAAGGHNFLMIGSPGAGKSMLAKRISTILPEMTFEESLETTKIYSVAGELKGKTGLIRQRPFRSPHHTVSAAGLSGGGVIPKPGELSLAHNGVLFLDELPEFSRMTMEVMRQPIEDGQITISRVAGSVTYPCSIMLVGAMNPCPCGYLGHPVRECTCSPGAVQRYLSRISGPLLDRIDIQVEVLPVQYAALSAGQGNEETSAQVRERVNAARAVQRARFAGTDVTCNAKMSSRQVREYCVLEPAAETLIRKMFDKMGFSARAYDKILKVARTVADIERSETISAAHLSEAIRYRDLDRKLK